MPSTPTGDRSSRVHPVAHDDDVSSKKTETVAQQLTFSFPYWRGAGFLLIALSLIVGYAVFAVRISQYLTSCPSLRTPTAIPGVHNDSDNDTNIWSNFDDVATILNSNVSHGDHWLCLLDLTNAGECWKWLFYVGSLVAQLSSCDIGLAARAPGICCRTLDAGFAACILLLLVLLADAIFDCVKYPTPVVILYAICCPWLVTYVLMGNVWQLWQQFGLSDPATAKAEIERRLRFVLPLCALVLMAVARVAFADIRLYFASMDVVQKLQPRLASGLNVTWTGAILAEELPIMDVQRFITTAALSASSVVLVYAASIGLCWGALRFYNPYVRWPPGGLSWQWWEHTTSVHVARPAFGCMVIASIFMLLQIASLPET